MIKQLCCKNSYKTAKQLGERTRKSYKITTKFCKTAMKWF